MATANYTNLVANNEVTSLCVPRGQEVSQSMVGSSCFWPLGLQVSPGLWPRACGPLACLPSLASPSCLPAPCLTHPLRLLLWLGHQMSHLPRHFSKWSSEFWALGRGHTLQRLPSPRKQVRRSGDALSDHTKTWCRVEESVLWGSQGPPTAPGLPDLANQPIPCRKAVLQKPTFSFC